MRKLIVVVSMLSLVACGRGKDGKDGVSAISPGLGSFASIGVELEDIIAGDICSAGGVSIFTFKDMESDGVFDEIDTILKVKSICHGQNGAAGSSSSVTIESVASSATCPQGGVKISSTTSSPVEVCSGKDGLNGEQGIQGEQGIPGMTGPSGVAGAPGSVVRPVKLCKADQSSYPEYGLFIDGELFAVNWGTTPGSPNASQAFLTKLTAGSYMSTGGNNCIFVVLSSGEVQ